MSGETEEFISGWTVDTLHSHLIRVIAEADKRYEERFEAQEKALVVALAQVEKEFNNHIQQVRDETNAALHSTEKAIDKSEAATEKRFEGVNEFRSQLSDQASTFMPRTEAEQRILRNSDDLVALASRLDRYEGSSTGASQRTGATQASIGTVTAIIGSVAVVMSLVVSVVIIFATR